MARYTHLALVLDPNVETIAEERPIPSEPFDIYETAREWLDGRPGMVFLVGHDAEGPIYRFVIDTIPDAEPCTCSECDLDRNGGHSPECEGYCHPSCPIGQDERRKANERARRAQEAWSQS